MPWQKMTAFVVAAMMTLTVGLAGGCGGQSDSGPEPVNLDEAPGSPDAYPPGFEEGDEDDSVEQPPE